MRLRLYRIQGIDALARTHFPIIVDRFPFTIRRSFGSGDSHNSTEPSTDFGVIRLVDDTLYVDSLCESGQVAINGQSVKSSPIVPGDRLTVGDREFVVSYERMTSTSPLPIELVGQAELSTSDRPQRVIANVPALESGTDRTTPSLSSPSFA